MKTILKSPEELKSLGKVWKVFLAGPIQGAPEWQNTLPSLDNVLWLSPRRESYENFDWDEQFKWETEHLLMADVILFWIPAEKEHVPGRSYAQTTRTEFGEYIAKGKKIIFGCLPDFGGRRYFEAKMKKYGLGEVHSSLWDCVEELKTYIQTCEKSPAVYFTSDTHFGSQRSLDLSKRPFKSVEEMDWTMLQKWNDKVHPCDTVYHLGDFGDTWPMWYLNGDVHFIEGNYEIEGKTEVPGGVQNHGDHLYLNDYLLCHEPTKGLEILAGQDKPLLFGHIHGRQKIKKFGVDVGVDSWDFSPISEEEVKFYLEAIKKGFYDQDVWIQ